MGHADRRQHRPRPTATILVALLVLAGCSGAATRSTIGASPSDAAPDGPTTALPALDTALGQAYLGQPLVGATVELLDTQGTRIDPADGVYDATTNDDGFFTVDPQRLPADFTVVVTDGRQGDAVFTGSLRRQVEAYNGWESLGVNAFTTLVAARHAQHGGESLTDAETAVRQYLGLGASYGTDGLEVGTTDTYFSETVFAAGDQAEPGNFDAYVDRVARQMTPGATHAYTAPPANQVEIAAAIATLLITATQATAIGHCSASQDNLNMDTFSGCVMGSATDPVLIAGLDRINARLQQVSDSINDLAQRQFQIASQIGRDNWNQLIGRLENQYFHPTRNAFNNLTCATRRSYLEATRERCQRAAEEALDAIDRDGRAAALADELTGTQAGRLPLVRVLADQARVAAGRFFRNPNQVSTGGAAPSALQSTWQYIDTSQMQLVWLLINFHNTKPNPDPAFIQQSIVAPYLGVPAVNAAANPVAFFTAADRASAPACPRANVTATSCRGAREQALRLLPQELPAGTVIDTASGLMWLQNIGSGNGSGLPTDGRALTVSSYDCGRAWPSTDGADCPSTARVRTISPDVSAGLTGWRTPTRTELDGLIRRGIDGPPTDTGMGDFLSNAGGFYWVFGPVDSAQTDRSQRPLRTIGTEVCLTGTARVTDPRFTDLATRVCSGPQSRAWSSTSNGQTILCGGGTTCVTGSRVYAVDLLAGTSTFGEINRTDAQGLWTMAVRPLGPCEYYYDDTSGPSPADRPGC